MATFQVTEVARVLKELGLSVADYHGELPNEVKARRYEQLMTSQVDVIVTTEALGLGLDKQDVREVVLYHAPKGKACEV